MFETDHPNITLKTKLFKSDKDYFFASSQPECPLIINTYGPSLYLCSYLEVLNNHWNELVTLNMLSEFVSNASF